MVIIFILINVAFITLIERKILGLIQYRKGPNKVSFRGLLQPVADAIKLFVKEFRAPYFRNMALFFFRPVIRIFLALCIWCLFPLISGEYGMYMTRITLLVLLGFGTYPLFIRGWASNRKYGIIGSLRGIAQTISYEIRLALIVLIVLIYSNSLTILETNLWNYWGLGVTILPHLWVLWILSCVAESNRTPFDFSEGESELVSGFNIEYRGLGFTLIFISEYSMIIFFSAISSVLFLVRVNQKWLLGAFVVFLRFFWVWLRSSYPRYRYDKLINVAWKGILPVVLVFLLWSIQIKFTG